MFSQLLLILPSSTILFTIVNGITSVLTIVSNRVTTSSSRRPALTPRMRGVSKAGTISSGVDRSSRRQRACLRGRVASSRRHSTRRRPWMAILPTSLQDMHRPPAVPESLARRTRSSLPDSLRCGCHGSSGRHGTRANGERSEISCTLTLQLYGCMHWLVYIGEISYGIRSVYFMVVPRRHSAIVRQRRQLRDIHHVPEATTPKGSHWSFWGHGFKRVNLWIDSGGTSGHEICFYMRNGSTTQQDGPSDLMECSSRRYPKVESPDQHLGVGLYTMTCRPRTAVNRCYCTSCVQITIQGWVRWGIPNGRCCKKYYFRSSNIQVEY